MTASQEASLPGIPAELRLAIYDAVLNTDVDCKILEGWDRGYGSQGSWSRPRRDEQTKLAIPWCSLLLTCKSIHAELEAYMSKTIDGLYICDIERRSQDYLGSFFWRRIDCNPRKVKHMIVNFRTEGGRTSSFFGDGGPVPVVSELFQSLNVLLHCGPRMDIDKPLAEPMHIDKLTIVPSAPDLDPRTHRMDSVTNFHRRLRTADQLRNFVAIVCNQGIVYGLVDRFEVVMDEKTAESGANISGMEVKDCGRWESPERWRQFGFEWGLDQFRRSCAQPDS